MAFFLPNAMIQVYGHNKFDSRCFGNFIHGLLGRCISGVTSSRGEKHSCADRCEPLADGSASEIGGRVEDTNSLAETDRNTATEAESSAGRFNK